MTSTLFITPFLENLRYKAKDRAHGGKTQAILLLLADFALLGCQRSNL